MDAKIKTMIKDKFELETRLDVELGTVTANTLSVVDGYIMALVELELMTAEEWAKYMADTFEWLEAHGVEWKR